MKEEFIKQCWQCDYYGCQENGTEWCVLYKMFVDADESACDSWEGVEWEEEV